MYSSYLTYLLQLLLCTCPLFKITISPDTCSFIQLHGGDTVLLEKLIVAQIVKDFPVIFGAGQLIICLQQIAILRYSETGE
jgi:hypothetical protein